MITIPTTFRQLAREKSDTSILDSGSAYGYAWQWDAIPADMPLEYARGRNYPILMISTAQLLDQCFTIDQRRTEHFRRWAELGRNDTRSWFELAREYVVAMLDKGKCGDGADGLMSHNTYNGDSDLDQVVEFTSPGLYASWHIVHVHTGCDVRGGYADPVVIIDDGNEGLDSFLCSDQISPWCHHCDLTAETLYIAEETGWKRRVNAASVSLVCPQCHRSTYRIPFDPAELAAEKAAKIAS